MSEKKPQKHETRSWKRELAEWGVMFSIFAFIYLMGWHTEILGRVQQGLLWTGLIQADTELGKTGRRPIDYDMPLLTMSGSPANLEDFKGEVIFLNFWATWCPPCIAEMPGIQTLYDQYKERDIAFVMISLDEDVGKARRFLKNRAFTFGSYRLNGNRPGIFRSSIIPTTYVIDKEGRLASKKEGMANYNTNRFKNFLDALLVE